MPNEALSNSLSTLERMGGPGEGRLVCKSLALEWSPAWSLSGTAVIMHVYMIHTYMCIYPFQLMLSLQCMARCINPRWS